MTTFGKEMRNFMNMTKQDAICITRMFMTNFIACAVSYYAYGENAHLANIMAFGLAFQYMADCKRTCNHLKYFDDSGVSYAAMWTFAMLAWYGEMANSFLMYVPLLSAHLIRHNSPNIMANILTVAPFYYINDSGICVLGILHYAIVDCVVRDADDNSVRDAGMINNVLFVVGVIVLAAKAG